MFVAVLLLLLTRWSSVDACAKIYKLVDENHSFCLPKRSIESFVPTAEQIELIVRMHNDERALVDSVDMQKMVKRKFLFDRRNFLQFWNNDVAEIAQRYGETKRFPKAIRFVSPSAEHCNFAHDTSAQRQAPRIPIFTGQNLGERQAFSNVEKRRVLQRWPKRIGQQRFAIGPMK